MRAKKPLYNLWDEWSHAAGNVRFWRDEAPGELEDDMDLRLHAEGSQAQFFDRPRSSLTDLLRRNDISYHVPYHFLSMSEQPKDRAEYFQRMYDLFNDREKRYATMASASVPEFTHIMLHKMMHERDLNSLVAMHDFTTLILRRHNKSANAPCPLNPKSYAVLNQLIEAAPKAEDALLLTQMAWEMIKADENFADPTLHAYLSSQLMHDILGITPSETDPAAINALCEGKFTLLAQAARRHPKIISPEFTAMLVEAVDLPTNAQMGLTGFALRQENKSVDAAIAGFHGEALDLLESYIAFFNDETTALDLNVAIRTGTMRKLIEMDEEKSLATHHSDRLHNIVIAFDFARMTTPTPPQRGFAEPQKARNSGPK